MRFRLRAVLAAVASGTVIAASVAACGPQPAGLASPASSAPADGTTSSDTSLDSLPFGSVSGGFVPLAGGQVASVPVGTGQTVTVSVAGRGGVPASGASAALLAVAVTGAAAGGSVTVYPADGSLPDAPSLSWPSSRAASGAAVSALSGSGAVAVHNSSAYQVTVTLDADGYWLSGAPQAAGAFGPLACGRVARVVVGGGQTVTVPVAGHGGVPGSGAGTVAFAVAATSAFGAGSATVYPAGADRRDAPGLSWAGYDDASGLVLSALSSSGTVAVHNPSVFPVTVTLDADGYWLSGLPAATGTFGAADGRRVARVVVGGGQTVTVPVAGHAGVPASGAGAAALTVQVPGATAGSVSVYAADASLPDVPSLAWAARQPAAGLAVSALSSGGAVAVHNSTGSAVTVTLDADGYWLSKDRTVSDITAKPTTVTLSSTDITAVSGDPAGTQTVTLAADVPAPAVGRVLVAPVSAAAPDGLLGTVTAVVGGTDGSHTVTLAPATLDQAYSTFDVSTSQTLTDSGIVQAPDGQTMTADAAPLAGTGPAASSTGRPILARDLADQTSGLGFDISQAAFTCKGSGDPTIALTADLSDTHFDLSLITTDPAAPSISFLITADPVFNINIGFTGTVTCELSNARFIEADIPIPGTPDLWVDLYPVLTFDASGQVSIDFQWKPRAAVGFEKGPGIDSEVHGFGSSGSVAIKAAADADLYLGMHADISLAGRVGVGGDFGPDLPASYDSGTGCVTVDGQAKADLTANASVFVKTWTFTLASGTFDKQQLFHECGPQTAPSPTAAPSTGPPDGTPTGGAGGTGWTAIQAVLPEDATDENDESNVAGVSCPSVSQCTAIGTYATTLGYRLLLLTGSAQSWTPASGPLPDGASEASGLSAAAVSCPSASECVAAGSYDVISADGSSASDGFMVLNWSGGSWTAAQAPMPANFGSELSEAPLGVSCASASQCFVAGSYYDASDNPHGLLLTWSDGTWTAAEPPLPANASSDGDASLSAVSCASASQCVAVGQYNDSSGATQGLLLTWSGGSWTAAEAPLPSDAASDHAARLTGVSCPSTSHCTAVGQIWDSTNWGAVALTWSGGPWTAVDLPLPANAASSSGTAATGVSCASATQCIAIGDYSDGGTDSEPMLLTLSGGSWTAAEAPLPANAASNPQVTMTGVSCASASQCVVTGWYWDSTTWVGLLLSGPG